VCASVLRLELLGTNDTPDNCGEVECVRMGRLLSSTHGDLQELCVQFAEASAQQC
jgi:hypothetical protein